MMYTRIFKSAHLAFDTFPSLLRHLSSLPPLSLSLPYLLSLFLFSTSSFSLSSLPPLSSLAISISISPISLSRSLSSPPPPPPFSLSPFHSLSVCIKRRAGAPGMWARMRLLRLCPQGVCLSPSLPLHACVCFDCTCKVSLSLPLSLCTHATVPARFVPLSLLIYFLPLSLLI
jgi:hypothetical protein